MPKNILFLDLVMLVTDFLTTKNKFYLFIKNKNLIILGLELLILIISILQKELGWLFSLNITLLWYPVLVIFWNYWFDNVNKFSKNKWPLFIFLGAIKFFIYTFPFFVIFLGNKYGFESLKGLFKIEASLIGIFCLVWFLIFKI